ncbi:MAG: hypothetical protein ACXWMY_07240 [Vulcanimicrobiaceae bacterium]
MRPIAIAVCCILAVLATFANAVPALVDSSPVHISSCYLLYRDQTNRRWTETIVGPLYITFANQSSKEVNAVRFTIVLHGRKAIIYDTGKFSPGITISHEYDEFKSEQYPYLPKTQPACTVTYVKFADGTIWRTSD